MGRDMYNGRPIKPRPPAKPKVKRKPIRTKPVKVFYLPDSPSLEPDAATKALWNPNVSITLHEIFGAIGITTLKAALLIKQEATRDLRAYQMACAYMELPSAKQVATTIDDLCGLIDPPYEPRDLMSYLSGAVFERAATAAKVIVASAMPAQVQRSVEQSLGTDDLAWEERREHLRAQGILPTPKGSTTNINVSAHALAAASAQEAGMPSFEDDIGFDEEPIVRALPESSARIIDVEAEEQVAVPVETDGEVDGED